MNNKGVSPVIATILMVAITVVLAAILYVIIIGNGLNEISDSGTVVEKLTGYEGSKMIYLFRMDTGHIIEVEQNTWNLYEVGQWYEYTSDQIVRDVESDY